MQLKKRRKTFSKITVGLVIKRGQKVKAQRILAKAFQRFKLRTGLPVTIGYKRIISFLANIIELRKVRVGRNVKFVPYPVKKARQKFNSMRQFFGLIFNQKAVKESTSLKISNQLISFFDQGAIYFEYIREKENLDIVKNRANAHYRW